MQLRYRRSRCKGVVVAQTKEEAIKAIHGIMDDKIHGSAGNTVVIEERLTGVEASVFALCNGTQATFLGTAQDHKRLLDFDLAWLQRNQRVAKCFLQVFAN